jgi:hypothetical protein
MAMLWRDESHVGNLTQEIKTLLRYQITILVGIWLIFAAPITCQYHGLLPLTIGGGHHHNGMPDQPVDNDHALRSHETVSSVTLSLFIVVLPGTLILQQPEPILAQVMVAPAITQEWIAPPPDKPPRLAI